MKKVILIKNNNITTFGQKEYTTSVVESKIVLDLIIEEETKKGNTVSIIHTIEE